MASPSSFLWNVTKTQVVGLRIAERCAASGENRKRRMARPERFELPTTWFEAFWRSANSDRSALNRCILHQIRAPVRRFNRGSGYRLSMHSAFVPCVSGNPRVRTGSGWIAAARQQARAERAIGSRGFRSTGTITMPSAWTATPVIPH